MKNYNYEDKEIEKLFYYPNFSLSLIVENSIPIDVLNYVITSFKTGYKPMERQTWCEVKKQMSWHISGEYPTELIEKSRPNESNEVHDFRRENYQPITKGVIGKAIKGLYRIFNERNYEIKTGEKLNEYIYSANFYGQSFINSVQYLVMPFMLQDPNAWIVALPAGEGVNNNSKNIEPYFELVGSQRIKGYKYGEYLLYLSNEKSDVLEGNNIVNEGAVFYLIDKLNFYKIIQTGYAHEQNFSIILYYAHNQNQLPATVLGGAFSYKQYKGLDYLCYESYFQSFAPFGNEALRLHSDYIGSMITSAYPQRIVALMDCDYEGCKSGMCCDENGDYSLKCPRCKGTGKTYAASPYGVIYRPNANDAFGEKEASRKELEYVTPPTEILKYLSETETRFIKSAKDSLELNIIDEAESGIAKIVGREREYALIMQISNNIFDNIIYNTLLAFEKYLNPNVTIFKPIITKPAVFSIYTEADIVNDLKIMTEVGAPSAIKRTLYKEYVKIRYAGNDEELYKQDFLSRYDLLYSYSLDEKLNLFSLQLTTLEILVKSIYSSVVLDKVLTELNINIYPEFYDKIQAEMDFYFKKYAEEYKKELQSKTPDLPNTDNLETEDESSNEDDSEDSAENS